MVGNADRLGIFGFWTGRRFSFLGLKGPTLEGLLTGLITLLVVAIIIAIVCYIVARLVAQFMPGAAPYVWIIWAIGGLIVLIFVLRLFGPALGVKL